MDQTTTEVEASANEESKGRDTPKTKERGMMTGRKDRHDALRGEENIALCLSIGNRTEADVDSVLSKGGVGDKGK